MKGGGTVPKWGVWREVMTGVVAPEHVVWKVEVPSVKEVGA